MLSSSRAELMISVIAPHEQNAAESNAAKTAAAAHITVFLHFIRDSGLSLQNEFALYGTRRISAVSSFLGGRSRSMEVFALYSS